MAETTGEPLDWGREPEMSAFETMTWRVEAMYPFGPVPGCAAMAALVSHNGTCCVGVTVDSAAITDVDIFDECLRAGFDEVLTLGGDTVASEPAEAIETTELI